VVEDRRFDVLAALGAAAVAALSVLYAVAYLGISPKAQRGTSVSAFYRSYLAHPAGARIASTCLLVSGLLVGLPIVALARRLDHRNGGSLAWVTIVGVVGGLATAAHGLSALVGVDKLAHHYATGDPARRAAVAVVGTRPSEVDPRGLATFLAAGLVALVLGLALQATNRRLGALGIVLGVDLVVLFVATAVGIGPLILVSGGLASVVLGPVWWVSIARLLQRPAPVRAAPAAAGGPSASSERRKRHR
jgi:hypothetical protein